MDQEATNQNCSDQPHLDQTVAHVSCLSPLNKKAQIDVVLSSDSSDSDDSMERTISEVFERSVAENELSCSNLIPLNILKAK